MNRLYQHGSRCTYERLDEYNTVIDMRDSRQKSANSLANLSFGKILSSSSSYLSKLLKSVSLFTLGVNGGCT